MEKTGLRMIEMERMRLGRSSKPLIEVLDDGNPSLV
jgi:hypothetical protein